MPSLQWRSSAAVMPEVFSLTQYLVYLAETLIFDTLVSNVNVGYFLKCK